MTLWIAIIGSGPAGYYAAEALIKDLRDKARIDIIDRLPTPYGLIRAGVAPDHQSIKAVAKRYEKTSTQPNVRFIGNVEIGNMVSIEELRGLYDAVVLATGAPKDRPLDIPGEDKVGVIGSAAFVAWYNAHPDFCDLAIDLNVDKVAVIGNGNVAIDVARVLAKSPDEMARSDLARHAAGKIHDAPIREIHVFGRRGPLEASFTPKELGELAALGECVTIVDGGQLPALDELGDVEPTTRKNLGHLHQFATNTPGSKPKTLYLHFYARPVAVLGDAHVRGLRLERTRVENGDCIGTGDRFELDCGLLVPCIGYRSQAIEGIAYDQRRGRFVNENGVIAPGLFCTGWARRGPSGTIGTNRPDAFEVAATIIDTVKPAGKAGGDGLDTLLAERGVQPVYFEDWKRIEAAEEAAANAGAPRHKFATHEALIAAARGKAT